MPGWCSKNLHQGKKPKKLKKKLNDPMANAALAANLMLLQEAMRSATWSLSTTARSSSP